MSAQARREVWYRNMDRIQVVLAYLVDQCDGMDEIQDTIKWVLREPWKYRVEYVLAVCHKTDGAKR